MAVVVLIVVVVVVVVAALTVVVAIGVTCRARGSKYPPIFFLFKSIFFPLQSRRGANTKISMRGGEVCMCIEDWYRAILPFLYLRKLKFLIPMFHSAHPPCY